MYTCVYIYIYVCCSASFCTLDMRYAYSCGEVFSVWASTKNTKNFVSKASLFDHFISRCLRRAFSLSLALSFSLSLSLSLSLFFSLSLSLFLSLSLCFSRSFFRSLALSPSRSLCCSLFLHCSHMNRCKRRGAFALRGTPVAITCVCISAVCTGTVVESRTHSHT